MKFLLLSALLAVALSQPSGPSERDLSEWELFKIEHEKEYKDDAEELKRRQIFFNNLKFIRDHNAKYEKGEVTFFMGMNHLGDKTHQEVRATMKGYKRPAGLPRNGVPFNDSMDVDLPKTVDWRKKGAVTGVKNQGPCGSCWAFSAVGSLEGQHYLKTKKLVSLSEQNLVDCSKNGGNKGCVEGEIDSAFTYIKDNKGIDTEESYPYIGKDGRCQYKPEGKGATCTGFVDITQYSEKALQIAVAKIGPVSVAIDASHDSFDGYKGGIYNEPNCSSTNLDHGVLAVGYGTTADGVDYWLVKNSWGTSWGMQGYMMIKRNDNNNCGIATAASYPTV